MFERSRSGLLALLVVLLLVSCITLQEPVSVDEAKHAYVVSVNVVMTINIGIAFGQEVSGVTLNEKTGEILVEQFDE